MDSNIIESVEQCTEYQTIRRALDRIPENKESHEYNARESREQLIEYQKIRRALNRIPGNKGSNE